jgi:hypothetical protein
VETDALAVLPSSASQAPEVRDATSVAASLVAWTGDPSAMLPVSMLNSPDPPDLYAPLELENFEVLHLDRDDYTCVRDESYAELPNKGRLHSTFYDTLVRPPARPFQRPLPPVGYVIAVVTPLPPWGEGVLLSDTSVIDNVLSADTLMSPVGETHRLSNPSHSAEIVDDLGRNRFRLRNLQTYRKIKCSSHQPAHAIH